MRVRRDAIQSTTRLSSERWGQSGAPVAWTRGHGPGGLCALARGRRRFARWEIRRRRAGPLRNNALPGLVGPAFGRRGEEAPANRAESCGAVANWSSLGKSKAEPCA
jgi:hypothetical protein